MNSIPDFVSKMLKIREAANKAAEIRYFYVRNKPKDPENIGTISQIGEWAEKLQEILHTIDPEQLKELYGKVKAITQEPNDSEKMELTWKLIRELQDSIDVEMKSRPKTLVGRAMSVRKAHQRGYEGTVSIRGYGSGID